MTLRFFKSLILGAAVLASAPAFADEKASEPTTITLPEAKKISKLSGAELGQALMKVMPVRVDGEAKLVKVYMARVEDGKLADIFVSDDFKVDPKKAEANKAFPGDMYFPGNIFFPGEIYFPGDSFFPGEIYFPGNIFFPGDSFFPGDMYEPSKNMKEVMAKGASAALESASATSGWVMIVAPKDGTPTTAVLPAQTR